MSKEFKKTLRQVISNNLSSLEYNSWYKNDSEILKSFPEEILSIEHLEILDLGNNEIKNIPADIKKLKNLRVLNLSNNQIDFLPPEIGELSNLEVLILQNNNLKELSSSILQLEKLNTLRFTKNNISSLPLFISEFKELKGLSFGYNPITNIPNWLHEWTNLQSLEMGGLNLKKVPEWLIGFQNIIDLSLESNKLTELPNWFINLKTLRSLHLGQNNFKNFPVQLTELPKLEYLDLWVNGIKKIPTEIGKLKELRSLQLGGNYLTSLPDSISYLQNLKHLSISNNRFNKIPLGILTLSSLESLILNNADSWSTYFDAKGNFVNKNTIRQIPEKISNLINLKDFRIDNDFIEHPPPEVVNKGIDSIRNYFQQIEEKGVDYLYEAKLLIVGEGGAGKTTLSKKIENPDYEINQAEVSTQGIDVTKWHYKVENSRKFQVNIWDFGGQEIYHGTHQFFLTKRSLYALVVDTRKEDTDFYYWLNIVKLLSNNSPLVIIKNEKQDRHRELNEAELRAQFENFKETIPTNLATNRGLSEVLNSVKYHISQLPHIGTPLPKTWVKVREELETNQHNYIDNNKFIDICKRNDFNTMEDILQLSDYLHDLGIILHFQNDPLLNKTIILKPKWGTDAVYKVLDNKTVIKNLGRFDKTDLKTIWLDSEYDNMHDELLQLMINFRLCYRIPSLLNDNYIAPQLLSVNPPSYNWDSSNNLGLRYKYEFMPKGLLIQFIVEMHSLIEDQSKVWRNGIIIQKDGTRAEIIENYNKREIQVRSSGKNQRDLLTIIIYEIDKINSGYENLKYKKLIPCNCSTCKEENSPQFYPYDTLKKFSIDNQKQIQCQKSYKMIEVNSLINELVRPEKNELRNSSGNISITGSIENLTIQQHEPKKLYMDTSEEQIRSKLPKSSWSNGLFYLFAFVIVIGGLGFLSGSIPLYTLALIIVSGIIIVPIIGAFQLRSDKKITEENFIELIKLVLKQLPLIRKLSSNK